MSKQHYTPKPLKRKLRGYAFDPSLSLKIETSDFNEVTYRVPWEEDLTPGPKGEYLEIIDFDPTIKNSEGEYGVFYKGVDLNDPYILAEDGLTPSDSNPQFHQQMVYAVAMKTIKNFEKALGRKIIWREKAWGSIRESYVERLRIYPHALREPNAFYSPAKRALLFGYFRSSPSEKQLHMPNSWVFTCLSHDIIAHEVTHAILDGLNVYYNEPTNPDVLAFHEAFADIVALFQHFTMPEVLKSQIERTKGNLEDQNLLGQLAQEFGSAVGGYGSLRDAIGYFDKEEKVWKRIIPDTSEYETVIEPHKRGSILVAAVFDAFLTIYKARVADLKRIAADYKGTREEGDLHPDLVNRLAKEASKTAGHVLSICIRAIDYCPPIDITFGEYLRAIITADCDLVDEDKNHYRLAFIDAFKRRGIYPKGIKTLSVESLRYSEVDINGNSTEMVKTLTKFLKDYSRIMKFRPKRKDIFILTKVHISGDSSKVGLHEKMYEQITMNEDFELLTGIMTNDSFQKFGMNPSSYTKEGEPEKPTFRITNLREVSRIGPTGKKVNQIKFSIVQTARLMPKPDGTYRAGKVDEEYMRFRGGASFIFDLDTEELKYSIRKPIFDPKDHSRLDEKRLKRQYNYQYDPEMNGMSELERYFDLNRHTELQEPFALLHNH
nr:hypothetical protein [uncultured Allomuricauda sp.]